MCLRRREGCLCSAGHDAERGRRANPRSFILHTRPPHPRSPAFPGPPFSTCAPAPPACRPPSSPRQCPAPTPKSALPCVFLGPAPHPCKHCCRPSPPPALSRVLLCCRPCLGGLISWCRPARWAWDAALQPLSEASPTSSPPRSTTWKGV